MRLLTTTTAALALVATGVFAEQHTSGEMDQTEGGETTNAAMRDMSTEELALAQGSLIRTRDMTGGNIYTNAAVGDEDWDPGFVYGEIPADWNRIGEIEDIVLTSDGRVAGIVAEVGGFLDIADKHVVLSVSDLNLVAVNDDTYGYVTRFSEEELENLPDVDEGFWE